MELSRANSSNPFTSLRSELTRLKGALQRINESIVNETESLGLEQALPAGSDNPNNQITAQTLGTETPAGESESATQDRERNLNERIQELENQIKAKEWLLKTREAQLKKLRYDLVDARISLMSGEKNQWGSHGRRKLWR